MKKKTGLFFCLIMVCMFSGIAPAVVAAGEIVPKMAGVRITREVPASEAGAIAGAGFNSVVIYYTPYRTKNDAAVIKHLKAWGAAAKAKHLNFFVRIDTGPPIDAVCDTKVVRYRQAASDDGYPLEHKPAPASADFWKTAIFPKLDTLAQLSSQFSLKGVFLNLDGHVEASFDAETFAEFLKDKEPGTDAAAIGAQQRKAHLMEKNLLDDYEQFQEDRIYAFVKEYLLTLESRAPRFEIHLTSFKDNLLHRAFIRAISETQSTPIMTLFELHTPSDMDQKSAPGATRIPSLSVREFTPDELAALVGALNLRKDGFLASDVESLWINLKDLNIKDWPLGLTGDYLKSMMRLKKSTGAGADAEMERARALTQRLSSRVTGTNSGVPKIALIYSGYMGYMYRDAFDILLANSGIRLDKYENTKLEKLVGKISGYDAIVCAPGYNAVKSEKLPAFGSDILRFVKNGGALFILDATTPAQTAWLGDSDPDLKLVAEQKDGLRPDWVNTGFKMLTYPSRITSFAMGKSHFSEAAPGWRHIARDNEGKPYVVERMYGEGMIIAVSHLMAEPEFLINGWEYMLKVKDRFDVMLDHNMEPIAAGRNEVPFLATTFGPKRNLKVTARVLNQSRGFQTSERSITLSGEGGARFTMPLDVSAPGLYRMTLTFTDTDRNRVDRRENFSFLAPDAYQIQTEKNYYTSEPEAVARVACNLVSGCGKIKAVVQLAGARGKARVRAVRAVLKKIEPGATYYSLPISNLKPGEYRLTTTFTDKHKRQAVSTTLRKLPPGPAVETKLLNFLGGLLEVNGKPFFPLGVYSIPPENLDGFTAAGANAMIFYGNTTQAEADIDKALQGTGIKFSAYPFYPHKRLFDEDRATVKREVAEKARNRNLFMWYLADEPEGFGQSPELIYDVYKFVKEIDPYRPQSIVMMTPDDYSLYTRAADVFMFDRYPTPYAPLDTVGFHAQRAVQAVYGRKPVLAIPQAFSWLVWNGTHKEGAEHRPTLAEMRSSAIQCIAADVKGIIYWAYTASRYDMRKFPDHEKNFKSLIKELSGLMDVLMRPNTFVEISATPDFQGIGWGVKILEGKMYIFAYNGDPASREAITFTLPGQYTGKTIEVYNENRAIPMQGRKFTDAFDIHGTHVYMVPMN